MPLHREIIVRSSSLQVSSMVPSCFSIIFLAIASPSPVPPVLCLASSPLTKGSKMMTLSSSGIPIPLSPIASFAHAPAFQMLNYFKLFLI